MSLEAAYNRTVDVKRPDIKQGADGSPSVAATDWAVIKRDMPCRMRVLSQSERTIQGREGVESTHRMLCDNFDFKHQDEVWEGADRYRVLVIEPRRGMGAAIHHLQLDLRRIEE